MTNPTRPGLLWKKVGDEIVISTPPKCADIVLDWVIVHEMKRSLDEH